MSKIERPCFVYDEPQVCTNGQRGANCSKTWDTCQYGALSPRLTEYQKPEQAEPEPDKKFCPHAKQVCVGAMCIFWMQSLSGTWGCQHVIDMDLRIALNSMAMEKARNDHMLRQVINLVKPILDGRNMAFGEKVLEAIAISLDLLAEKEPKE